MPNVWLTYAWKDNDEGAFDYLVDELERAGVTTRYDKIQLVPGRRLWEQVGDRMMAPELGGWAYLLTPNSMASEACREELAYALSRALQRGNDFPLIGLVHQVPISEVPIPLKVRLCVDLRAPNWVEQVKAGLENRPPARAAAPSSPFVIRQHQNYMGVQGQNALEFRPHLGEKPYWRMAYPSASRPSVKGSGPAGGGGVGGVAFNTIEGTIQFGGVDYTFYGEGTALTPAVSAYIAFDGPLPLPIHFGFGQHATDIPSQWFSVNAGHRL